MKTNYSPYRPPLDDNLQQHIVNIYFIEYENNVTF